MKANILKVLHTCETDTGWTKTATTLIDTTGNLTYVRQGKRCIEFWGSAGDPAITWTFSKTLGLGGLTLKFWCCRWSAGAPDGYVLLMTDDANYGKWNVSIPANTMTAKELDVDNPDSETGTFNSDLVTKIRIGTHLFDKFTYLDFFRVEGDVESKISNCIIWSPMYQGSRTQRPFGYPRSMPWVNWDKRYQMCLIRVGKTNEAYFQEKDIIEITDDTNVCFYGRISTKQDRLTSYILWCYSWGDELMESVFPNAFSAKRTDEMLITLIGDSSKSTEDSSIDQTTITLTLNAAKPFYAELDRARYLERGVFWRVPGYDGKCYFDKDITDVNILPLEPQYFPAEYNFSKDTVGVTGTSISWIDSKTGTDSNPLATLIASEDGHKKVIKFVSDGGNGLYYNWGHNPTDQASGTIELHAKYVDKGVGSMEFYFMDSGASLLIYGRFNSADNKFYISYGDGVGGHTTSNVAAAADTWHHLKFSFNCTTDLFSCWVNETALITDKPFYDDLDGTALATYRMQLSGGGGANSLEGYIDAVDESWASGYSAGRNITPWSEYSKGIKYIGKSSYAFGITRAHVWGGVNSKEQVNKKSALTTEEQEIGAVGIFPFIDTALTNYTEVNQLATALKNIYSATTLFINLRIYGLGFLQWCYRVKFKFGTDSKLPTEDDYMILEWIYDAKNDVYLRFILTNNTVFEREFINVQKQLGKDVYLSADCIDVSASESTSDGTVLPQATLAELRALTPIGTIHSHLIYGSGGFVPGAFYGASWEVAFSDALADIYATFSVDKGGSFKVSISHAGSGANNGKTASGILYINYSIGGEVQTWDVSAENYDLTLGNAEVLQSQLNTTAFTVANDSHVGILWQKDDNAGGAAGTMRIYNIQLVRQ